nr:TonB-dependent receptor [Sphingomonas sp. Y57]
MAFLSSAALAPGVALAQQPAGADEGDGAEIIVTAQRRDQRLLDTPISIGVLGGGQLESGSSRAVADVLREVAGVSLTSSSPGTTVIAIRGVQPGSSASPGGVGTSTTGFYQDDVPFAFIRNASLPDANSYDLDRVEVLRGPQGTLYGVNALNGVVRVLTADADLDEIVAKGRVRASTTRRGGENFTGDLAVSMPLIPGKLAVRAVVGQASYSGYIRSSVDGRTQINDYDAQNYRFKINFQPSEALSLKAGWSHNIVDSSAQDAALDDFSSPFTSRLPDKRVLDIFHLTGGLDLGGIDITSTTGYIDYDTQSRVPLAAFAFTQVNTIKSLSEELRIASSGDTALQWQVGGLYKDTKEYISQDPRPTLAGVAITKYRSKSYALFGELTYKLTDRFEATGGLRYFKDKIFVRQLGAFNPASPLLGLRTSNYNKLTGRAVLTWKPSEQMMVYTSYSTGFRSGWIQAPVVLLTQPTFPDANADSIENFEAGSKGRALDGLVSYDAAVYHMKWKGVQQQLIVPGGFAAVLNAGNASGWGAEAAVTLHPTRALSFSASVGWNDLKYDQNIFQTVTVAGVASQALLFPKGSRVNDSPEWTIALGADYRGPISAGLDFYASTDFAYTSARILRFLNVATLSATQSDKISTLSATMGVEANHWSIGLFADNLLDERGALYGRNAQVRNIASRLRPRTIGIQASFKY